jgi:hypothetical protein
MSVHQTRKTVAAVALATILAASPIATGKARPVGHSHNAFSWLQNPISWVAAALGLATPQPPIPSGPITDSSGAPADGRGFEIDPMGGSQFE